MPKHRLFFDFPIKIFTVLIFEKVKFVEVSDSRKNALFGEAGIRK
jgi:hypothetical protein